MRADHPGAVQHVFARGNNRAVVFRDDRDRMLYLSGLGETVGRYGWRCLMYVLMGNHVHLLVETPAPNLAAGMQWLHGRYAQRFNARHGRVGHVFQGRYGSTLVTTDEQLWTACAYIALNPVHAGLCRRPTDWRWGSHRALVTRTTTAARPDHQRLLELLGTPGTQAAALERFLEERWAARVNRAA